MANLKFGLFTLICAFMIASHHPKEGMAIDQLDGVNVYYNGDPENVFGRNLTDDGYNLGLKYQCVEFVKRYYLQTKGHKMTESYGHAKDYFDLSLGERGFNETRGLMQYRNTRKFLPKVGDILVFDGNDKNPYGHMAIVSKVDEKLLEIIQQNWGLKSRHSIKLVEYKDIWTVADFDVLGWLRKENNN